jgi:hypothetical protein
MWGGRCVSRPRTARAGWSWVSPSDTYRHGPRPQQRSNIWPHFRSGRPQELSRTTARAAMLPSPLGRGTAPHDREYPRRRTASEPQDRVTELVQQQTAISEVLRAIASSPHDLQPVFDAILDSATRLCRADLGSLRLSEESGLRLVRVRGDPLVVSQAWSSFPVLAEKGGLLRGLATSRLPIHFPDLTALEDDLRNDHWIAVVKAGFRTGLVVPLLNDDELVGIIALGRPAAGVKSDRITRAPGEPSSEPSPSGRLPNSVNGTNRPILLIGQKIVRK